MDIIPTPMLPGREATYSRVDSHAFQPFLGDTFAHFKATRTPPNRSRLEPAACLDGGGERAFIQVVELAADRHALGEPRDDDA